MKFKYLVSALSASALLGGCGGGSDGPRTVAVTPAPTVSAAVITSVTRIAPTDGSADLVRYGTPVYFQVKGSKLSGGVTLGSTGCTGAVALDPADDAAQVFTCIPSASGAVSVTFAPTNGTVQATAALTIPVPQVTMVTSMGTMVYELNPNAAPITVANFIQYVRREFYTGTIFHRVISGYVVQGGGYTTSVVSGVTTITAVTTLYPAIALEVGKLSNTAGTIAMARTTDPASATSQFYINVVDNTKLDTQDGGYAVFGKVISGFDVAQAMQNVPTQTLADSTPNVPVTPVLILSASQTQ